MLLKIDEKLALHSKRCMFLQDAPDGWYWCTCDRKYAQKGDAICILKRERELTYIVDQNGEIGITRISWWTELIWRFNTVKIRDIKNWNGEDVTVALGLLILISAFCLALFCSIKTATATGMVDGCMVRAVDHTSAEYSDFNGRLYVVEGHRSWRSDKTLFVAKTYEEASSKMKEICKN